MHQTSKARQAGLLSGVTTVGYQILTNLLPFAACFVYVGYTKSKQHIYDKLRNYEATQSVTTDIVSKLVTNMGIMDDSLHKLKKKYDDHWRYHDQVYTMLGVLNEINRNSNRLKTITEQARQGRVAMEEIGYFMNLNYTTPLEYVDLNIDFFSFKSEYTEFISAEECDNGESLHINFAVILEYTTAKIYEIDAFNYWDIMKSPPQLMTYVGKQYVLHDEIHNCRKAMVDSKALLIAERCVKQNYLDPQLNRWDVIRNTSAINET